MIKLPVQFHQHMISFTFKKENHLEFPQKNYFMASKKLEKSIPVIWTIFCIFWSLKFTQKWQFCY